MKYISAEEFLKQDKKIQKAILDWWQPEFGDLIEHNGKYCIIDTFVNALNCCSVNLYNDGNCTFNKDKVIPLLTEGQLRKYIEDKIQSKITDFKYCLNPKVSYTSQYRIEDINSDTQDLLEAYWKMACKVSIEE